MGAITSFATSDYLPESADAVINAQLVDENGDNISSSAVSALVVTLLNDIGAVLNSRNQQSALNTNNGTLSSTGAFELQLQPADMAVREAGPEYQARSLTIKVTHSGTKVAVEEIRFYVRKLRGHP